MIDLNSILLKLIFHVYSKEGLENVCRVLCTEIQLYKKLIWRGVNLDVEDKKLSLKELENTCPIQANVDDCP